MLTYIDEAAALYWPEGTEDADSKMVMPGDNVEMLCETHHPLVVENGQRFNVREGGRYALPTLLHPESLSHH